MVNLLTKLLEKCLSNNIDETQKQENLIKIKFILEEQIDTNFFKEIGGTQ